MIKATNELEKAMCAGTSYLQCFRGIDLRRTEIASMAWIAQAFCGAALMGYSGMSFSLTERLKLRTRKFNSTGKLACLKLMHST